MFFRSIISMCFTNKKGKPRLHTPEVFLVWKWIKCLKSVNSLCCCFRECFQDLIIIFLANCLCEMYRLITILKTSEKYYLTRRILRKIVIVSSDGTLNWPETFRSWKGRNPRQKVKPEFFFSITCFSFWLLLFHWR